MLNILGNLFGRKKLQEQTKEMLSLKFKLHLGTNGTVLLTRVCDEVWDERGNKFDAAIRVIHDLIFDGTDYGLSADRKMALAQAAQRIAPDGVLKASQTIATSLGTYRKPASW